MNRARREGEEIFGSTPFGREDAHSGCCFLLRRCFEALSTIFSDVGRQRSDQERTLFIDVVLWWKNYPPQLDTADFAAGAESRKPRELGHRGGGMSH